MDLKTLGEAVALRYVGQDYPLDLAEYRAFDELRDEPGFRALKKARLDVEMARQRAAIIEFDEQAARAAPNPT